jgi:alpha-galactosidase
VREALGPDAFVVACSAPAAAGVGYVSAHRVGPDIEPRWVGRVAGVRDAARALAANWFWQGRTWVNDPDYLIPCESEAITRFWATMVALSGGSVVLSADLAALPAWAEELLAFVAPPIGRAARPLDLFANAPDPRLWHLPLERGGRAWHLAGVVNWREHGVEERVALDALGLPGPVHVWDVWRRTHRIAEGEHVVPLAPQDATILAVRTVAGHPQLVGTDVHVAQGWVEIAEERWDAAAATLTLRVAPDAPRAGRAWVWAPDGLRLDDGAGVTEGPADRAALGAAGRLACVPLVPGATVALRFTTTTD